MHMRTACIKAEQKNSKQTNQTLRARLLTIREYLEEGKLLVLGAFVVCVCLTAIHDFLHHARILRRLLLLPDDSMYNISIIDNSGN